ncbi:Protein PCP-1, partial [Aphelenchoides avenae]
TLADLQFLTVENVLADYVDVINDFRTNVVKNENAPVIVYGSKYAGLLAAWLKVQNDQLITGAIASSAPVLDFDTNTEAQGRPALGDYDKRITQIYTDAGCNLVALKQAFSQLESAKSTDLNTFFRLSPQATAADKADAIKKVRYLARQALYAMAENNYPYPAKTGAKGREMVANPVQEACKSLKTAGADAEGTDDLKNLAAAIGVYYGTSDPIVVKTDDPAYIAGTVQPILAEGYEHCTGTALYRCPMGDANDFFPKDTYCKNDNEFIPEQNLQCKDWLGSDFTKQIDTTWIRDNIKFDYASKNKIVFVTGSLDPNAGGVYSPKDANADAKKGVYAYQADQGTTGHDLLEPNTCDPNTVKNARYQ